MIQEKSTLRLTFNPGLALTDFELLGPDWYMRVSRILVYSRVVLLAPNKAIILIVIIDDDDDNDDDDDDVVILLLLLTLLQSFLRSQ